MASRCNVLSLLVYLISATLFSAPPLCAHQQSDRQTHASFSLEDSPCLAASPKACLELALQAMGGHDRLTAMESLRLDDIGHSLLVEQSYRQDPFITSYERTHETLDFKKNRVRRETHLTWPESDPNQSESDSILIVTRTSGVCHSPKQDIAAFVISNQPTTPSLSTSPASFSLLPTFISNRRARFVPRPTPS